MTLIAKLNMHSAIDYCRRQQQECREKRERDGWDDFTALGLSDWLHEEIILMQEYAGEKQKPIESQVGGAVK